VVLLVLGADTTLSYFDDRAGKPWSAPRGRGSALWRQAHAVTPDPGIAVVAWLGYAAPRTSSSDVLTDVTSPTPG